MIERVFDWLWIIAAAIIVIMIAWMTLADAAECLPSVHAVRAQHGAKVSVRWSPGPGNGCYQLRGGRVEVRSRAASAASGAVDRIAALLKGPGWQEGLKLRAARIECENASSALMRTAMELREKRVLNERLKEWFAVQDGYRHVSVATRVVGSAVPAREVRDVHFLFEGSIERLRPAAFQAAWEPAVYSR